MGAVRVCGLNPGGAEASLSFLGGATLMKRPKDDRIEPTAERLQHGVIERVKDAFIGDDGKTCFPYQAFDLLAVMERRNSITPEMRIAGDRFHDDFAVAGLSGVRAADVSRVPGNASPATLTHAQIDARRAVADAMKALGGMSAPLGCCVWNVLGLESTLEEWARREGWRGRPISPKVASGLLLGALGILVKHY